MAPPAGGAKRKRGDRSYSGDSFDGTRPSPHRPGTLNLAHHNQSPSSYNHRDGQEYRGRGGRRGNRGGAGRGLPRSPHQPTNYPSTQIRGGGQISQYDSTSLTSTPPQSEPFKPAEPKQQQSLAVAATQTPPPEDPPSYYTYDYLDEETVKQWVDSGQDNIISDGVKAREDGDTVLLSLIFQELVRSALDGRIQPEEAGSTVGSILQNDNSGDENLSLTNPASLFLDTITMFAPNTGTKDNQLSPREIAVFRSLLQSCGVPREMIYEELELEHLSQLGFTRNTFERMRVRFQTQVLYRQSNYNLLREESEGYSKLITELFTTSGNEPPSAEVVSGTFQRVKGMIGAFDLDVGRVLDITLDIFAAVLVRKYRFFVKYLRASTWWPHQAMLDKYRSSEMSFRTLPTWALPDNTGFDTWTDEEKAELAKAKVERDVKFWDRVRKIGIEAFFELGGKKIDPSTVAEDDNAKAWLDATGIVPQNGNIVAAQVLGFKLRFYSSPARSASDTLPPNLIWLSALLIKIGFITLKDLYPHLWPDDEMMSGTVKEQKSKEKEERERANRPGGGANNALAMAGVLTDDTLPPSVTTRPKESASKSDVKDEKVEASEGSAEPKEDLPEPSDQKVQLLKSLLCIGALPEALFMLGRFPWLLDAFTELPEHIHRILHHCLSKVYEPLQPLRDDAIIRSPHTIVDPDQHGVGKGNLRRIAQPPYKTLRWAQLDRFESNEGTNYVFYWDDWADNIPVCQSVDDVFALCHSLLALSGVKIGQDPALLTKLARIGKHSLSTDNSESNKSRWIELLKKLLVPALSLTRRIPGVIEEIWDLVKQFPIPVRFSIYAEWYHGSISRNADIKSAFDQSRAETKDCLKRISKTNVKPMARLLAKIATSSPGIVFAVAIGQIESYDNLVDVVVECGRYFTFLGYDVLTWSLMNALGTSKARVQADGMLTSRWLQALAEFSGKVFKRYSVMSPGPVLQYVLHQLQKSNPTDLVVLEEIISSMTGIVSDTDLNDSQVIAMSGGRLLQAQIMLQLLDRRHEPSMRSTAKRLMRALVDLKLAGSLVVAIAQERQTCVFRVPEVDAHLKLLGNIYDKIQRVLVQYLDLLRTNLSVDDFNELVPSLPELIGDFGLEPSTAFWISRPSLAADVTKHDDQIAQEKAGIAKAKREAKEAAKNSEADDVPMTNSGEGSAEEQKFEIDGQEQLANKEDSKEVEIKDDKLGNSPEVVATPGPTDSEVPWHPVLQKTIDSTQHLLPEETFKVLSESFYFTFWQMSLGDVFMPINSYEAEFDRLKRKQITISNDRSDLSTRGTQKKEEDKKAVNDLLEQLQSEMGLQIRLFQRGKQRLAREKDFWFSDCWGKWDSLNVAILEHCFIPRASMSPVDAMYTVKLLKLLHTLGTKYFRTVGLLDQLFNKDRLTSLFFLCTNREADNIGRFLNEVLKDLARWHADKAVYEKEAHGTKKDLFGFCTKFTEPATLMEYEDFRRILLKWHRQLNDALKLCFQGGEYMHIRNAIAILKACVLNFPMVSWMGASQVNSVTELSKTEKRGDLKLAAKALLGHLKRREGSWVMPQSFSLSSKAQGVAAGKATPKSNTPQPDNTGAKLNAKAPEFKPQSPAQPQSQSRPAPLRTDKIDIEEGELKSAGLVPENNSSTVRSVDLSQSRHAPGASAARDELPNPEAISNENLTRENNSISKQNTEEYLEGQTPSSFDASSRLPPRLDSRPANLPSVPPKPNINGRNSSHSLPNRPEGVPSRIIDRRDRPTDRHYMDETQSTRYQEHRREGSGSEYPSQRDHGYHGNNYGARHERERQDSGWSNDRAHSSRPVLDTRYETPPGRDTRGLQREDRQDRINRDRAPTEHDSTRMVESSGRLPREGAMAPPRPTDGVHSDRGPPRALPEQRHTSHPDRRADATRHNEYSHPGSQRSSRGSSPVRRDDRSSRSSEYQYRDERTPIEERRISDNRPPRNHYDDNRLPSSSRGERTPDLPPSTSQSERFRESFNSSTVASTSRYSQGERTQESSFGRLNADPPSGPRTNGAPSNLGVRSGVTLLPHVNTQIGTPQNSMPSPAVSEKQTPTGPSSSRPQTRQSAPYSRSGQSSGPPTPSAESPDTAGVHPDRLKAIQGTESVQGSPRNNTTPAAAPSGPRGPVNAPLASVPVTRSSQPQQYPPNDRSMRSDRRFAGVNSILQQPGQPTGPERSANVPNTRGRGTHAPNIPLSPSGNGLQPHRQDGPPEALPPTRDHPPRQDVYNNRPSSGSGHNNYHDEERSTRDVERRSSGRHDNSRPESPRRYTGLPSTLPPAPTSRIPREDVRQSPRRIDDSMRRDDLRDIRGRSGGLPPTTQERELRRPPREDQIISGRDMRREHDGRRDSGRDEWGKDRTVRERRDVGPERRDTGPPLDPTGSYGRRKRGAPEDPQYDPSKRSRR